MGPWEGGGLKLDEKKTQTFCFCVIKEPHAKEQRSSSLQEKHVLNHVHLDCWPWKISPDIQIVNWTHLARTHMTAMNSVARWQKCLKVMQETHYSGHSSTGLYLQQLHSIYRHVQSSGLQCSERTRVVKMFQLFALNFNSIMTKALGFFSLTKSQKGAQTWE